MKRGRSSGVSLVEVLVSIALGVILGLAAAVCYVQAKYYFLLQREVAQLQDSGRQALRLLGREVASSGFFAGLPGARLAQADAPGEGCVEGWALGGHPGLQVVDDFHAGAPAGPDLGGCLDPVSVAPGTDVMAVRRTAGEASVDGGDIAPGLPASATQRWYLRSHDAEPPGWRQYSASALRALETTPDVSLWRAISGIYFVRRWAVQEDDGIPALCVEALAGSLLAVRCLVEGVEDLQVQFGFDTDGDGVANRYGDAGPAGDTASAVSARIFLLLRSINPLHGSRANTTYALGNRVRVLGADGYLRQVMTTTVALDARARPLG
jgi:hypothetical protein